MSSGVICGGGPGGSGALYSQILPLRDVGERVVVVGLPSAWFMRTINGSGSGGAALASPGNASQRETCRVTASATAGAHEELGK